MAKFKALKEVYVSALGIVAAPGECFGMGGNAKLDALAEYMVREGYCELASTTKATSKPEPKEEPETAEEEAPTPKRRRRK